MTKYFLQEGGAISEQINTVDWNKNPLGAIEKWPQSLKTSLSICLNSQFPMLISWGPQLIMLYNNAYSALLDENDQSKAIGQPTKVCWPEIWDTIGPLLEKVKSTGESILLEDQLFPLIKSGVKEDRYFTFSYSPIRDEEGIRGVFTVIHETTEKVLNDRRAKHEQERLIQFFNQAPAALCILDGPKMIFELVNPSYQQLFPGRDLLGKQVLDALPEIKGAPIHDILQNVYNTGETFEGKELLVPLSRQDGAPLENLYFNFIYQPRWNTRKEVDGILVFAYEVNDIVLAKKQNEANFKRFEKLANTLPQIVWTATPDGNLDYFNDQWLLYSGLNFEQSVGQGWASAVHPEDLPGLSEVWANCLISGDLYQVEARIRSAENIYKWVLIRALAIKNEENLIDQWCGTCTLIQDQKESEQNLQALSNELYAANEEIHASNEEISASNDDLINLNNQLLRVNSDMDNFIYTASHDLKAPISNIEGLVIALTRYLSKQSHENPVVFKLLPLIRASIERFKKTLLDLTEITKLQRLHEEEETAIDLEEIVDDIKLDLSPIINESNGQIKLELNDVKELKYSSKNLRSILYNLISNGLKYRSSDRDPIILITCQEDQDFSVITVQDNGLGMDLENNSIFGMFKRLHNHVEGSGIGLYIVKKIIDNAGVKIEVESKVGEGSTFKLFFKKAKK